MRRFSLYRRNGIFYARFWDTTTKSYASAKSTGERTEKGAQAIVAYWDRFGFDDGSTTDDVVDTHSLLHLVRHAPLTEDHVRSIMDILKDRKLIASAVIQSSTVAAEPLIPYLERFWNFDDSEYVAEKQNYGHSIGRRHCYEQTHRLEHWRESFADKTIGSVTRDDLRAFVTTLKGKELASKTIKNIITVGSVALAWLADNGDIESNPAAGLKKFSGKPAHRGILTIEEARRVFAVHWPDERARVGNLVAMTTGLRSGEILALRREDIGTD
ncbi:MAG: hypothetical protein HN368_20970, partial [Spirochaetales bacterium]|nr:hypothetical protein [Spirochaetales bacterium]